MTSKMIVNILELFERVQRITVEFNESQEVQRVIIEKLEKYGKDR